MKWIILDKKVSKKTILGDILSHIPLFVRQSPSFGQKARLLQRLILRWARSLCQVIPIR